MSFKDIPVQKPELLQLGKDLGIDRIQKIIFSFYQVMSQDTMIGFFFTGRDIQAIAQKQSEFLYKAMGLKPSYSGKAPADAHHDLPPILTGHFDRRLKILEDLLKKEGLSQKQITAWIGFENAFRDAIVSS